MSTPLVIDAPPGACLGWFHPACAPARDTVVVMCRPIGYEALCSYTAYAQIAQALARCGFDVLRFDYHGTGDSDGGDTDPDRVDAWLASCEAAVGKALQLSGATSLVLFGMRLGATLALQTARRVRGVSDVVLWAPCASGRQFVREMKAAYATHADLSAGEEGGLEALGSLFTKQTLDAITALAPDRADEAPAPRAFVIGRDDLPGEGPLPARLRTLGSNVGFTTWPGYSNMMAEPHDWKVDATCLDELAGWLALAHPAGRAQASAAPNTDVQWRAGPVRERALRFGERDGLFGVLSEPLAPSQKSETAVLLLNVGGNYRIGANRIYVKIGRDLASAGYRALRMDVSGVGDSRVEEGFDGSGMFRDYATGDVSAAIDALQRLGCTRFVLLGICSGAYLGFQAAMQDARVGGQMIINARLLEWDAAEGEWQGAMRSYYKSTRYYRQALLRGDVYKRLLRGEVDVRGIAGRFAHLAQARLRHLRDRVLGRVPKEGVLAKTKYLCSRGVDTLVAVSEEDDSLDYIQLHLGQRCRRMRGHDNFRMALIEDADHTFSTVASQRAVMRVVREHLERMHETPAAHPEIVPEPLATT